MSPAEHRQEAERLIGLAGEVLDNGFYGDDDERHLRWYVPTAIAAAQVHATLAGLPAAREPRYDVDLGGSRLREGGRA